jgi:hypothetical protein
LIEPRQSKKKSSNNPSVVWNASIILAKLLAFCSLFAIVYHTINTHKQRNTTKHDALEFSRVWVGAKYMEEGAAYHQKEENVKRRQPVM